MENYVGSYIGIGLVFKANSNDEASSNIKELIQHFLFKNR